jgi:hypothetical protein
LAGNRKKESKKNIFFSPVFGAVNSLMSNLGKIESANLGYVDHSSLILYSVFISSYRPRLLTKGNSVLRIVVSDILKLFQ